jgi:succinyl-diaminopimelate desuccinylase
MNTSWTDEQKTKIDRRIEELRSSMIRMQTDLTARPALGPANGGVGEVEKCNYMKERFSALGLQVTEYRCPDPRVPCGYRPSLIGLMPGRNHDRTVWIMTHLDVVPPGAAELWKSDPYQVIEQDGRLFGRGVEDNQQEMVASFHTLQVLHDLGLQPYWDTGLVLAADEETGSRYGIDYVLKQEKRFRPDDLIIVADAGNDKGSEIEVAEKSIIWLKFATIGRQTHGATPQQGVNAHRAGAQLLLRIDQLLHERYAGQDPLFAPPVSTAEPTKKEANVPNINTIPGDDVFYFDCRILPQYPVQEVLDAVRSEAQKFAEELKIEVRVTTEQMEQAAPPTSPDAPVVKLLSRVVKEVYGLETKTIGVGGGTVAAFFRRAGFPAAVWGRYGGAAHQPNEFCIIDNMVGDARVYAHLLGEEPSD